MSLTAFVHGTAILPDRLIEGAVVVCQRGRIVALGARVKPPRGATLVDAGGGYIAPGFVDLHCHGGDGADFMDGTVDAVERACRAHARHGTTTLFPTTTTGAPARIAAMLDACREAARRPDSTIGGVHLYGPYFAPDKVGCHDRAGRRAPDPAEYAAYLESGVVRIATCAAELPGAEAFYRAARRRRCLVTCGHSNASWTEMARGYRAGLRHVDHFWCAMSSIPSLRERLGTPMQASMAEFVLSHPAMSTEVIADGCHLAPELLEFAYRQLGPTRLCLVTDCNRALDQPPGRYRFGSGEDGPWFESDGRVGRAPDGALASSVVGMDHMVRQMRRDTSAPLPEVVRMASLTPAQRAGIGGRTGSLAVGKRADVLILSRRLEVRRVFVRGRELSDSN